MKTDRNNDTDILKEEIGIRLFDLCERHNLNANSLSLKTGIKARTIYRHMNGDTLLSLEDAATYAHFFGITIDYFVTGKSNPSDELHCVTENLSKDSRDLVITIADYLKGLEMSK